MTLKTNPADKWYKRQPLKDIDHLSASSVSQFLTCGLQWKLGHVDHLVRKQAVPSYFVFGTAFHEGLRPHWRGLESDFKTQWQKLKSRKSIEYHNTSWLDLYRKGMMMTAGLVAKTAGKFDPAATMTEFADEVDLGFVKLVMRIDVLTTAIEMPIIVDGREVPISGPITLDVKSSAFAYTLESINQSQQLLTYAIPSLKRGRTFSAYAVATKANRPVVQLIGKKFSKDEIKGQVQRVKNVADHIHQGVFTQVKGEHCGRCDFRDLCYSMPGWQERYTQHTRRDRSGSVTPDNIDSRKNKKGKA